MHAPAPLSPSLALPSPSSTSAPVLDLPQSGAPGFTRQLFAALARAPSLAGWIPDPTVFSALLLALIVKQGGVIVDAPKKNARAASREVTTILRCIFGLSPLAIQCDESTDPTALARAIATGGPRRRRASSGLPLRNGSRLSRADRATGSSVLGRLSESPGRMSVGEVDEGTHMRSPTSEISAPRSKAKEVDIANRPKAQAIVVTGLERASTAVAMELVEIVNRGWVEYAGVRRDVRDALVVWVRAEGKPAPFWLVDEFVCSAIMDGAEATPDFASAALIPPAYLEDLRQLLSFTHVHPPLQTHMTNLLSALLLHPRLDATVTARAAASLGALVRGHRLLQGDFDLPAQWAAGLRRWARSAEVPMGHAGGKYAGGRGGVDTWGRRAGEEPDVADLRDGGGGGGDGDGDEGWHALPRNVAAVWASAVRHRVSFRERGEESLWVLVGSARERAWGGASGRRAGKTKDRARDIEDALEDMLVVV